MTGGHTTGPKRSKRAWRPKPLSGVGSDLDLLAPLLRELAKIGVA